MSYLVAAITFFPGEERLIFESIYIHKSIKNTRCAD